MAYNPYSGHQYGPPAAYNAFPGANGAPGMHPGLGMSPAPGLAPPPGMHPPSSASQANRPSGVPPSFPNMPNINFNAPVIRLGGPSSLPARPTGPAGIGGGRRGDIGAGPGNGVDMPMPGGSMRADYRHDHRSGLGFDQQQQNQHQYQHPHQHQQSSLHQQQPGRISSGLRESIMVPPTNDEKLRTIFVHKVPPGVGGEAALEKLLRTVGKLRRWDSGQSHLSDHKGELFGFAQYEDAESLATAIALLKDVQVPLKKQAPSEESTVEATKGGKDGSDDKMETDNDNDSVAANEYKGIGKAPLQVAVDPVSLRYIEAHQEARSEEARAEAKERLESSKKALRSAIRELFFPQAANEAAREADGDVKMSDAAAATASGDNVEVLNIPLAQDDELADIPAEMREIVASEIASFRERSNRRDMERLKMEQEMEEQERLRSSNSNGNVNGHGRPSRRESPPPSSSNNVPLGPRGASGSSGHRGIGFVNESDQHHSRFEDVDTDASDEELYQRVVRKQAAGEERLYDEAEHKWVNRERQRAAALEREKARERAEAENDHRHRDEQLERDRKWDDEYEASRKNHLYHRDHAAWLRKRAHDRADEEARDAADRRAEQNELRRQAAEMETAKDMADSFLEKQAQELGLGLGLGPEQEHEKARTAHQQQAESEQTQEFTISFGAAAQRAQAQRSGATRIRTMAEVEGLLDDEEQESTTKRRQLVPIKFEPMAVSASLSDEELNRAVRALAQEIPTERSGLWAWAVHWECLGEAMLRDKLRPFVEKKVVEYLGVQEQFLVEVVEEHLRQHGRPEALVEELQEALDDAAEDLVKKLWRMVIFFTESEKRGLPA